MEKRFIIALVLAMGILYIFNVFSPGKKGPVREQIVVKQERETVQTGNNFDDKRDVFYPEATMDKGDIQNLLAEEEVAVLENNIGEITFSNIGGNIKEIAIAKYWTKSSSEENEIIYTQDNPADGLFSMGTALLPGLRTKQFEMKKGENTIEYSFTENDWMEVVKTYTFDTVSDSLEAEILVRNLSPKKMVMSFSIVGPSDLESDSKVAGRSFMEANLFVDGKLIKKKSVKSIERNSGSVDWVAFKDRYFVLVLKPFSFPEEVVLEPDNGKSIKMSLVSKKHELRPGEEQTFKYLLYAGVLDEKKLADIGENMNLLVNYGIFGGVSKVLLTVLKVFYNWFHNWGAAIIFLTLLINLVLLPLTGKSFKAMQQMKTIQPHLVKLKELHKDNPQKLNKETMELYKKYNVNPLGGCLPLLLQMPIFIALYQGLIRSVGLKGAGFLWIKDLAKPDAVAIPLTLPFIGNHINILPLLMCVGMFLQQKISMGNNAGGATTDEQANQQKMMMIFMPIFFGFLFYNMPSGLVLYWLMNTILMTSEHAVLSRNMNKG